MRPTIVKPGTLLTEDAVADAEKTLRRKFPAIYRDFLLEHNGGSPEKSDFQMAGAKEGSTDLGTIRRFLGVGTDAKAFNLEYVLEAFRNRIPANMFPVARDPGGNLILLVESGPDAGKVFFWDHEREADDGEPPTERNLQFIADSFDAFLDKLGEV